ncbi:MAG: hypothetical protein U0Y82_12255 [Thermoleophilia bacterium]
MTVPCGPGATVTGAAVVVPGAAVVPVAGAVVVDAVVGLVVVEAVVGVVVEPPEPPPHPASSTAPITRHPAVVALTLCSTSTPPALSCPAAADAAPDAT